MKKLIKFLSPISFVIMTYIIVVTMMNKGITIYNPTADKTATIINEVEAYGTDYVYNEKKPSTSDKVVLVEGINGLDYTYDGINYTHLNDMSNEVVEVGTGAPGEYNGKLTGYGPDCPGCSKVGNVSCLTREKNRHSLINDGIYYTDEVFGKIRIVAADNGAFPCGTIIKIDNGRMDAFYAVVLDSGSSMRAAWQKGNVWIDLAFSSQSDARKGSATSSKTEFSVQRWGW